MNTENQENYSSDKKEQPEDWIKEIASRSYEPELLISGAGIYLSYNLPFAIEWAFDYYNHNLLSDADSIGRVLPVLIYGFLKSNSYILVFTFLFHFMMRAFWVGMVGLYSVFPEGIRYDNLGKQYNEFFKQKAQGKLGSTESFIVKLDRNCSIIFSVAFMLVFGFIGISYVYMMMILLINALSLVLGDELFIKIDKYVYFGILTVFLIPIFISTILSLKVFKKDEKKAKLQANITWRYSTFMYPFVGLALMRLTLIFRSNSDSKKEQMALLILSMSVVFGMFIFITASKVKSAILETRSFYSQNTEVDEIYANNYDNLRQEDENIKHASIQSDVIKEEYIKLFINYPKRFDKDIRKICSEPKIDTTLKKQEKRILLSNYYLGCMQDFFKIYLNDSLIQQPEFVYYQHSDDYSKGIQTYLSTETCKTGKNLLKIEYITTRDNEPDSVSHQIPFWIFEKK